MADAARRIQFSCFRQEARLPNSPEEESQAVQLLLHICSGNLPTQRLLDIIIGGFKPKPSILDLSGRACTLPIKTILSSASFHMGPTNLWSNGVFNAHHADAGESSEDVIFTVPVWLALRGSEIPVRQADGPQALGGHGLDHFLHHVVSVPWAKHFGLPVCGQDFIAPGRRKRGYINTAAKRRELRRWGNKQRETDIKRMEMRNKG